MPKLNGKVNGAGFGNYTVMTLRASHGVGWNNNEFASGPWPHSRYVNQYPQQFTVNLNASQSGEGSSFVAYNEHNIFDDDLVGGVSIGGKVRCPLPS